MDLLVGADGDGAQALARLAERLPVVDPGDGQAGAVDVGVLVEPSLEHHLLAQVRLGACEELVEHVEVPLALALVGDAGLLEQVLLYSRPDDPPAVRELDADELAEAGGVVVAEGPRVAEGLEDDVRVEHPLLELAHAGDGLVPRRGDPAQVAHDHLGRLGLPCPGLAADDDRLDGVG